jgi:2,3-bisphosphoglycerate-dependent phosphoglycerate mutase
VQLPDAPLSERGVAQAERLARRLAATGVARILASDLPRALVTAQHLQRATGAPLEVEPVLQERNFGDVRGTPYARLDVDLFAPDYAPPGGESWEIFHARVDRAWQLIRARVATTGGPLAVVTHGLVCRSVAARHVVLPPGDVVPERWENTSLTILHGPDPWHVRLLNCVAHLDGLAAGRSVGAGPV